MNASFFTSPRDGRAVQGRRMTGLLERPLTRLATLSLATLSPPKRGEGKTEVL